MSFSLVQLNSDGLDVFAEAIEIVRGTRKMLLYSAGEGKKMGLLPALAARELACLIRLNLAEGKYPTDKNLNPDYKEWKSSRHPGVMWPDAPTPHTGVLTGDMYMAIDYYRPSSSSSKHTVGIQQWKEHSHPSQWGMTIGDLPIHEYAEIFEFGTGVESGLDGNFQGQKGRPFFFPSVQDFVQEHVPALASSFYDAIEEVWNSKGLVPQMRNLGTVTKETVTVLRKKGSRKKSVQLANASKKIETKAASRVRNWDEFFEGDDSFEDNRRLTASEWEGMHIE